MFKLFVFAALLVVSSAQLLHAPVLAHAPLHAAPAFVHAAPAAIVTSAVTHHATIPAR